MTKTLLLITEDEIIKYDFLQECNMMFLYSFLKFRVIRAEFLANYNTWRVKSFWTLSSLCVRISLSCKNGADSKFSMLRQNVLSE